jgi:hypothetical protein
MSFVPRDPHAIDAEVFYKRRVKTVDGDLFAVCSLGSSLILIFPVSGASSEVLAAAFGMDPY